MGEVQKKNINCRICLRYDLKKTQKCFSLFEKYNSSLISDKIKYVTNIEIKEGDGLPSKICPDCLLQLENSIVFKQKCETSNKILHSIVQKPLKICKITFRVPLKKEIEVEVDDTPDDYHGSIVEYPDTELKIKHEGVKEKGVQLKELHYGEKSKEFEYEELDNEPDQVPEYEELDQEPEYLKPIYGEPVYEPPIDKELKDTVEKAFRKSKAIDLKLICDDCGGSFKSKCKLAVHWKRVHLHTKLICPHCKRMFKSFKAFHMHEQKKTRSCIVATKVHIEGLGKNRLFHCKDCEYNTKHIKDMDAHLATHSGDRRFQCKDCFKCFTQYSSLQGHRESYHKDYRVETTCHFCGKLIKGRGKYYKHLRTHQPKTVQCEVCKKTLKSRANLANHMKRHSGVRSCTCEICSANFYTTAELCNHRKRVHFKSKSFKCDMCEYSSYTASLLKAHRSHHTLSNVVCLMCGIFVENAEKLAAHQKRHLEKNFPCPHCDKTFFLKDSVRRHVLKKHMSINKQEADKKETVNIKKECTTENKYDVITLSPTLIS